MIDAISSSTSALHSLGEQQGVSANNIADAAAANFRSTRTQLAEGANGSVRLQTRPNPAPVSLQNAAGGGISQGSNVDIAHELATMNSTKIADSANLKSLQVADEMAGRRLDLKA